jgi:FlaA1/EpsC-like NDP-sugar epimerase
LQPHTLVLAERSENALFQVERSLAALATPEVRVVGQVIDVRDEAAVQRLFARYRPEVVFHAAAHKHVPLMEKHPAEAVLNNVGGTLTLIRAAHGIGTGSFVFVSTDKAVHPSSIMGLTKRVGELCIQKWALRSETRFMTVRFGNVLGSNGSVLPIFIEQIQQGGPVTVTHPDMTRYFMSISEACRLLLRAAAQGRGGELFLLDMSQPMKIVDLAARVIERAGLRPEEDVPIVFSGARPGEKLSEQLMFDDETRVATASDGVWSVKTAGQAVDPLADRLDELLELAQSGDDFAVRSLLAELVGGSTERDALPPEASIAAGE